MPTLPHEPDLFPNDLLDHDPAAFASGCWALVTRSRQEKELMRRLRARQIAYYGPLIEKCSRTPGGRARTAFVPLFPNYVFLFGDAGDRYDALTTNCVVRDLPVFSAIELLLELRRIRELILSGLPLNSEPRSAPGARVRVCCGPLRGQEGIILKRRDRTRLLVSISFLQQGASVEIDESELEVL